MPSSVQVLHVVSETRGLVWVGADAREGEEVRSIVEEATGRPARLVLAEKREGWAA